MTAEKTTIRAVVRALDGEEALVEVEQGGCGRCHEKGGCGGQQLTQMFCSGPKTYRALNDINALVGERVTVAIAAGSVRQTANLAYGVPLTAAIGGALLGTSLGGDLVAMLGAAIGLAGAVFYIRRRADGGGSGNFAERPHLISRS